MLKTLAAHFKLHVTLDSYSLTLEESHTSVGSAEDIRSTKHTAR